MLRYNETYHCVLHGKIDHFWLLSIFFAYFPFRWRFAGWANTTMCFILPWKWAGSGVSRIPAPFARSWTKSIHARKLLRGSSSDRSLGHTRPILLLDGGATLGIRWAGLLNISWGSHKTFWKGWANKSPKVLFLAITEFLNERQLFISNYLD